MSAQLDDSEDIERAIDEASKRSRDLSSTPTPTLVLAQAAITLGVALTKTMLLIAAQLSETRASLDAIETVLTAPTVGTKRR